VRALRGSASSCLLVKVYGGIRQAQPRDGSIRSVTAITAGHDLGVPPRPRVPAYERIAADLRARIAVGEFPHDVALPGADALAEEYGVSRRTAHRAVRVLVDDGLLVVRANYGTFLA
jgi:Bacterial regulatory proteins, gntR family